jgi:GNAT superfamily N-acetyltransferase
MMFDDTRSQFFPVELVSGITARAEPSRAEFWQVVGPLMEKVFTPFAELGAYELPKTRCEQAAKLARVFANSHRETFILYNEDKELVGWSYGEMRDAETFFMTNSAVLPEYQGRGIYSAFMRRFLDYLSTLGYERVVSNHQTNNRAVIIAKLKLGFNVTAVNLDERWGAQVELTYLFHDDRQRGYERAFSLERRP